MMFTRWSDIDRMFGMMDMMKSNLDRLSSDYDRAYGSGANWVVTDGMPRCNLYDSGDHFTVIAEVPGFSKEDLNIKIQGNYLELSGSRKPVVPERYSVHRSERGTFNFSRSMTLPSDVDSEKVEASLKNGILTLTLPKSEAAKPRQITVK